MVCSHGWENIHLPLFAPLPWQWLEVDAGAKATDLLAVVDSPAPYTQVQTVN